MLKRNRVYILLTVLLVIIDRLTKAWASQILAHCDNATMPFIDGIIRFRYTVNTGAAFSLLSNARPLVVIITAVLLILIALLLRKYTGSKCVMTAGSLIMAGGISHLYDRAVIGYVVDFIEPTFIDFAVFNAADIYICCGAVLMIIYILFFDKKEIKK